MRAPPKIVTPEALCERASRSSAIPRASSTSSVRAIVANARLDGLIAGQRSNTVADRPRSCEVTGGGEPGRARADDQDIDDVSGHHATAPGFGYQRRMSSGVATAPRLNTKRQPGWATCAALTIISNSSVLPATSRTPAPISTAS